MEKKTSPNKIHSAELNIAIWFLNIKKNHI